jgi:hypothetical protein
MRTIVPARVSHADLDQDTARIRRLDDTVPGRSILVVAAAWVIGLGWLLAVTPAPDPAATPSTSDALVQSVMLMSWIGVIVGLATRQRWGLVAGSIGGVVLAAGGVLCVLTGHTGFWIAIQIGVGIGLAVLSHRVSRLA